MAATRKDSKAQAKDVYQVVTEQIASMLEKGLAPWRQPWGVSSARKDAERQLPRNIDGRAQTGGRVATGRSAPVRTPTFLPTTLERGHRDAVSQHTGIHPQRD
jgi:antirestriction protein ArdC